MPHLKKEKTVEQLWKVADRKANKTGVHKTVFSVNSDQYTGEYRDNLRDGKGTFRWHSNGAVYDGDWKAGRRCGYGTYSLPSKGVMKKIYAGGWKNDKRHGFGTHYFSDNEYYEGEFYQDKRSGWGRMYYADGSTYEGEWYNDNRNGNGMLRLANNNRYEGSWKDDMKHGEGKFFYLDKGQIYEGFWINDIAKCGEFFDYCREEATNPTEFELPELLHPHKNEMYPRDKATCSLISRQLTAAQRQHIPPERIMPLDGSKMTVVDQLRRQVEEHPQQVLDWSNHSKTVRDLILKSVDRGHTYIHVQHAAPTGGVIGNKAGDASTMPAVDLAPPQVGSVASLSFLGSRGGSQMSNVSFLSSEATRARYRRRIVVQANARDGPEEDSLRPVWEQHPCTNPVYRKGLETKMLEFHLQDDPAARAKKCLVDSATL